MILLSNTLVIVLIVGSKKIADEDDAMVFKNSVGSFLLTIGS